MHEAYIWIGFNLFVLLMLSIDFFFHREARVIGFKEALVWSAFWIVLALLFCLGIYYFQGHDQALNFLTGYLIEKSLSIDNLFVFIVIFSSFAVPKNYLHKVLMWGVLGALVMRAIFIFSGVVLINMFHWLIYIFGAFLVFTGIKFSIKTEKEVVPEKNIILRAMKRIIPITDKYEGDHFFVVKNGKYWATPLFAVLVTIETTDILFALDSVPAILAITRDTFIVYTSNVFAILGLRALFFALAGLMPLFHYLHYGLSVMLIFIGAKMILSDIIHVPTFVALGAVVVILGTSILASIMKR